MVEDVDAAVEEAPPTMEGVLIRTGAEALIRTLGRRKGEMFVKQWAGLLADEESVRMLFPIRPPKMHGKTRVARAQAVHWFRQRMSIFVAAIPPK